MRRRSGTVSETTLGSSVDRLFTLSMGYVGFATFVLVFFFSIAAMHFVPSEPLFDQAVNAPLQVWILSTTIAAVAVALVDAVRRAATRSAGV